MQRRHLITLLFVSAVFFLSYGSVEGKYAFGQPDEGLVTEPVPTTEDEVRFEQIAAILSLSATGNQYLDLRERYNVVVRFEPGQGSSFSQAANRIRLDSKHDPLNAALIFVHEMHHARTLHEGRKANPQAESRQEYVSHMLWEESEGMAAGIQAKLELEDNGVDMGGLTLPFEEEYCAAYQGAVDQSRLSEPATSAQELSSIGMTAGVQALFDVHLRRETRSANTHEFIVDYYGRVWDEANPSSLCGGLTGLGKSKADVDTLDEVTRGYGGDPLPGKDSSSNRTVPALRLPGRFAGKFRQQRVNRFPQV